MLGTCNFDSNLKSPYEELTFSDGVNKASGSDNTPGPFELNLNPEESEITRKDGLGGIDQFSGAKKDFMAFR